MRKQDIYQGLSAAYPIPRETIEGLALGDADEELIASIVAEPQESPVGRDGRRRVARYAGLFGAVAVAYGLLLAVVGTGGGSSIGTPAPAYGAALLRLAKISPHILLQEPGWRPVVVESLKATEGFTDFERGGPKPGPQRIARFRWRAEGLAKVTRELTSHGAVVAGMVPVLGTTAQVYTYGTSPQGIFEAVALWTQSDRAFEFRASVPSIAILERRLTDLHSVSRAEWLAAVGPLKSLVERQMRESKAALERVEADLREHPARRHAVATASLSRLR